MTFHPHLRSWRQSGIRAGSLLGLAALLTATGCGSGAYQDQYNAALAEQQRRSDEVSEAYDAVSKLQADPQLISAAWPMTLRRPKVFIPDNDKSLPQPYVSGDPHRYDQGPIAVGRLHPPFMSTADTQMPGFQRCWESVVEGKDKDLTPYYMYVAVVPAVVAEPAEGDDAADGEADDEAVATVSNSPAQAIYDSLSTAFPEQMTGKEWEPIMCPRGEWDDEPAVMLSWKRLSVEAKQEFLVYKSSEEPAVAESLNARFDVCLYEGAAYHVVIAWRVPLERGVEAEFDLDAVQKACLGTLKGAD